MFYGFFEDKKDICSEFGISDFEGVVLYASYECPDYDGYAEVVYLHKGVFYTVSGSHCSCYGLEGQWIPEEMPEEALRKIAADGDGRYSSAIRKALAVLSRLNVDVTDDAAVSVVIKLS